MERSEQIAELAMALSKAQGCLKGAEKDATNTYYKNSYSTLTSVWDCIRKPLSENGLSIVQTIFYEASSPFLKTTLFHSSGQWINSQLPLVAGKGPQDLGASMTYMRRYAICALVGVTADEEDDDGNQAQKAAEKSGMSQKKPIAAAPAEQPLISETEAQFFEKRIRPGDTDFRKWLFNRLSGQEKRVLENFTQVPSKHIDDINRMITERELQLAEQQKQGK